jgi:hypothetical protein
MSTVKRREGLRAPLFYTGAAVLLLLAGISTAQTTDQSALEACAGLETAELRLACFEAIVAAGRTADEPAAEAEATAVEEKAPEVEAIAGEEMAPAAAAVAPRAEPDVTEATSSADDFGREQLDIPEPEEERVLTATVTDVSKGNYDVLYFHLANGQVWRQIEPRHFSYPKGVEFDVTISQGMMGEYRLRVGQPDDKGRMVRIRRVK